MRPLADEIRPQTLDEVAGQKHLLGEGALLRRLIESGAEANLIFYGPSGTGKTTIANIIARKQGCEALVTGESLAQVASQTVKALQCTDAAQDLPILRPLIGMDKTEIVETARHINTFETSILPYEDCCTIFTPPHPKIRPELAEILEAEAAMPGLAALEAEAAESAERIRIRITDQVEFEG